MRCSRAGGLAILLALGALLGTALPGGGQVKLPEDFVFEKAEDSPGRVTFSHRAHQAKIAKCTTCHLKTFRMKRGGSGQITLAAKQEGKFCGACHDGQTTMGGAVVFAIDQCDACHKE